MEVKIRDVEPYAVKKIDELARKHGLSRNAYLKCQLETIAVLGEIKRTESRYETLVQSLAEVIRENTVVYEKVLQLLEGGL